MFLSGKKTNLKLRKSCLKLEKRIILPVMSLGISSFVMLSTESLLSISFSSSLARYGGDVAVGAMTVITSVSASCARCPSRVCARAVSRSSASTLAQAKKDRVRQAFRFQLLLCGGYTTVFWVLMMLVPGAVGAVFYLGRGH